MKIFYVVLLLSTSVSVLQALECMACRGINAHDCDTNGKITACQVDQSSCETVVRRQGSQEFVNKGCRETMSCNNNQRQNAGLSGQSTQCNSDQYNSFCTCCCDGNLCNVGSQTCSLTSSGPRGPANDCPDQPSRLPHGNIDCSESVCNYTCTDPNYVVYPPDHVTNICQSGATWLFDTPCCARPCPPYLLYDSVSTYHIRPETVSTFFSVLGAMEGLVAEGDDAVLSASYTYGESVIPSSVTKFGEFTLERFLATIKPTPEGPSNTGAAIQFALDQILQPQFGMRDDRVPKSISIFTDSNSDDDVVEPAERARSLGYLLYVYAFRREGVVLNEDQLLQITGDKEHIFYFDQNFKDFPPNWLEDLKKHYCSNPCDHVLHDHQ